MTTDTDGTPSPHAPRIPSDPPPRRPRAEGAQTGAEGVAAPHRTPAAAPEKSNDTDDATTHRRAMVRAILSTVPAAVLPLAVFALRLWCRAIAATIEAVTGDDAEALRAVAGSAGAAAGAAADDQATADALAFCATRAAATLPRKLGAAQVQGAADALFVAAADPATARVFELLSVVWFDATPHDVDPALCIGLPAEALADLDALEHAPPPPSSAPPRILRVALPAAAPPDPSEHSGRFDGPRAPDAGPTAAELSAMLHDAAAYLVCREAPEATNAKARELVLQVMTGGGGDPGACVLAALGAELAALAAVDAAAVDRAHGSPVGWRDRAHVAAWGSRLAARAFRMTSAACAGVADVRDTELPDLAPWRAASGA